MLCFNLLRGGAEAHADCYVQMLATNNSVQVVASGVAAHAFLQSAGADTLAVPLL